VYKPYINFTVTTLALHETGSSVSIVSGYGLDDRAIEVRSPAEAKGFFSLASVSRPGLGPTQPRVQWVPGVLSLGLKRGRGVTLTTHHHKCRGRELLVVGAVLPLSPSATWRVVGQLYLFKLCLYTLCSLLQWKLLSLVYMLQVWKHPIELQHRLRLPIKPDNAVSSSGCTGLSTQLPRLTIGRL
jgi:hypothetical protein